MFSTVLVCSGRVGGEYAAKKKTLETESRDYVMVIFQPDSGGDHVKGTCVKSCSRQFDNGHGGFGHTRNEHKREFSTLSKNGLTRFRRIGGRAGEREIISVSVGLRFTRFAVDTVRFCHIAPVVFLKKITIPL